MNLLQVYLFSTRICILSVNGFLERSILLDDSNMFNLIEKVNFNCLKKKPLKYRMLPNNCRLSLSNLMNL